MLELLLNLPPDSTISQHGRGARIQLIAGCMHPGNILGLASKQPYPKHLQIEVMSAVQVSARRSKRDEMLKAVMCSAGEEASCSLAARA